jgi:hypothetical protein
MGDERDHLDDVHDLDAATLADAEVKALFAVVAENREDAA